MPWASLVDQAPYGVAIAIKAVANGKADEAEQKLFLNWLIYSACKTYDLAFRPDVLGGQRGTDFALGMQFVGQSVVGLLNLSIKEMKEKADAQLA